ncbi:hypothetical protein RhiirC2_781511 [Rhizophagus irregularis]|uniref:Uncharacterized protein n=1 Tax=Rhizophagus irregularis TaxID=588596 RepID=A0A2N1N593_9GLOM|nr:hypothetical protein RhiirC2_781511 [Rhizophagus irregularis]
MLEPNIGQWKIKNLAINIDIFNVVQVISESKGLIVNKWEIVPDCICKNLNFKERRGHKCVFYPKYHCELNHIGYTWTGLQRTVPKALDSAKIEDMNKNHGNIWIIIEKKSADGEYLEVKVDTLRPQS